MDQALIVMTSFPDEAAAKALAQHIIEIRLAACVHILPGIQSIYSWEGSIQYAKEVGLQIKTTRECYAKLEKEIKKAHSFDVPEIIALPIVEALPSYLGWIKQQTKKDLNV